MFRLACTLCLLLSVQAARVSTKQLTRQSRVNEKSLGGPHKCTIVWKFRDQVASASFGVSTCKTECLITNSDYNPSNPSVFPRAFTVEQRAKSCVCFGPEHNVLLQFPGKCGDESAAKDRCWQDYKRLATDTWVARHGKTTPEITHHPETYTENHDNFNYGELKCADQQNMCGDDLISNDCFEATLPSIFAGRDASLLADIAKIAKMIENGEMKKSDVDRDTLDIIAAMPEAEKVFYSMVNPEGEGTKEAITVGHLKEAYEGYLENTGLSVDNLLKVAGFDPESDEGLAQEITSDDFQRFLNPEPCAE